MSEVVILLGGALVGAFFLSTLQPKTLVKDLKFVGRTIEGGRDVQEIKATVDHQPPIAMIPDVDSATGLPFHWVVKQNGTRSKSFTNTDGVAQKPFVNHS